MKDVLRIVEHQAHVYGYTVTENKEEAEALETLIDLTKPKFEFGEYDELIGTPFRYPLPIPEGYAARFRPPMYDRNVFYCSETAVTCLYECTFHFMRQRIHLTAGIKRGTKTESGTRTRFVVALTDTPNVDLHGHKDLAQIMSKTDYASSHKFVHENPKIEVIRYPSARDPNHGPCFAVFEIKRLAQEPKSEKPINFLYDYKTQTINWIEDGVSISWKQVS